jgi:hypothetical protein
MKHETSEDELYETAPKTAKRERRPEADITKEIDSWATKIKSSRQNLLDVQLSQKGEPAIAPSYLETQLDASYGVFKTRTAILNSVIQRMIDEQIIIPGHNSIANEWRRKLLRWYESMTDTEKQAIPVVANTISVRRCLQNVAGMGNLKWARLNIPLVEQTFSDILSDLEKRGVVNANYQTVAERKFEADKNRELFPRGDTWETQLNLLRSIPLSHVDDLVPVDPQRPFVQIFHMFAAASMTTMSSSGQLNFVEGFKFVSQHLKEAGYTGIENALECITPNYLPRLRNYLTEQLSIGAISSHSAQNVVSSTRKLLKRLLKTQGIGFSNFVDIQGFKTSRETDEYRPYSSPERDRIKEACELEIRETNELAADYQYFNGGSDPCNEKGNIRNGHGTLENARWIFENKLSCRRLSHAFADQNNIYEKSFCSILKYSDSGIIEIYKSWGVIYEYTSRLLAPYVIRLAQITGLNADSLKSLDVDDFIKCHEITRRPYLRYWKERSDGEKLYHLDLMNADLELMNADVNWLSVAQSVQVEKIFNDVIYLTRSIRDRAPASVRNKLFIYESLKRSEYREIKSMEKSNIINLIMNRFAKDHNLKKDNGDNLAISASRLRPSLVAELIDQGVSLREIQMILGHRSITTTIKYLDQLEFSKTAQKVVDEALQKIHKEYVLAEATNIDIPKSNIDFQTDRNTQAVSIRTGLVECRNVYDPPPEIRNSPAYKEGNPCSLLNKCLSCRNSIITASNLPDLFAMRRDYRAMMATSTVAQTPYGRIIVENLETLDSILTPSAQGFDTDQLDHAERLSEHILTSTLVEGMTL